MDESPVTGAFPYATVPRSFRLPAATRVGIARLQVADLDRSIRYYEDLLGFRARRVGERATLATAGGDQLVELTESRGAASVPRQPRLGLFHYAILLPDRAALGRFVGQLSAKQVRAGASDHGVSEALYLRDPDGHGIEVYADRAREEWPIEAQTLALKTEPLDLELLLRAGGGGSWDAMPAGTTVGHVHLHVGDLEEAEAFYHHALGLDIVARISGALFLSAGGYHHHLGVNTWAAGSPSPGDDEPRLLEWTLVVPSNEDADAAGHSLRSAGYAAAKMEAGWVVDDPWRTRLRITAA